MKSESLKIYRVAEAETAYTLHWLAGGVALTIGSHLLAQDHGSIQVVWWGAILWGFVDIVLGLVSWLKGRWRGCRS